MTELIGLILLHIGLGLVLTAAIWASGLGVLLASARRPLAARLAVVAYAVGLLIVVAVAFAFLLSPWVGAIAAAVSALSLWPLARARITALRDALVALAWALPFVGALPFALGLLLHGPTDEVPSSAYGDYVFWATRTTSAADSILPFQDLLVADRKATYVEGGSTFVGAAASHLPGFDPFLFQTTALPTVLVSSLALGFGFLFAGRERVGSASAALLAALAVATIAYPSWLPESPPVSLAAPLALVLYALYTERLPLRALAALSAVLVVDIYLTKGFVVLALAIVLGVALVREHADELRRVVTPLRAGVALTLSALAVFVLWRLGLLRGPTATLPEASLQFVPADAVRGLADQLDGRDTQAAAPALGVVGALLLGLSLYRVRAWTVLAVLVTGLVASWTIVGYGFDLVIGVGVLLAVLLFRDRPGLAARERPLLVAATVLLGLSSWFRDISGYRAGFVLVLLLGAALFGAFLALERDGRAYVYGVAGIVAALLLGLSGRSFVGFLLLVALAVVPRLVGPRGVRAAAAAGLVLAVGVAGFAATRDGLRISRQPVTLTTNHRDIWLRVGELVPKDALVFTSMTGETIDGDRGWNYYPGVAGRQLYIGGWYDGPLLVEPEERARRLRVNRAVLTGRAEPADEPLAREFDSHFAVVRADETVPGSFRLVYRNPRFAIYRIT